MKNKALAPAVFLCFLLLFVISSCSYEKSNNSSFSTADSTSSAHPCLVFNPLISKERVSRWRTCLNLNFTLSETGIYTTVSEKSGDYILYCDLQSDTFVKLCGRPDCLHTDVNCDAYLGEYEVASPIGYYQGALYYIRGITYEMEEGGKSFKPVPATLMKMDKDGRNKTELVYCYREEEKDISTTGDFKFTHGYVEGNFGKVNSQGEVVINRRYTSLETPDYFADCPTINDLAENNKTVNSAVFSGYGEDILCTKDLMQYMYDDLSLEPLRKMYCWDPAGETLKEIGEIPYIFGTYSRQTGYYYENGYAMQWDYEKKEGIPLFDTGIKGQGQFLAFPDCIAVYECHDELTEPPTDGLAVTIRFFDWNYALLDECQFVIEEALSFYGNHIFGETDNRILIIKNGMGSLPDYYIEKSDFGTGNITLHEYHYPDMDLLE